MNKADSFIILAVNKFGSGEQARYYKIKKDAEVTIGRGFDCDIILDDPFICAHHIKILKNFKKEQLRIEGFQTINGFKVNNKQYSSDIVEVGYGDKIYMGKTIIRIYNSNYPVKATKKLTKTSPFFSKLENQTNCWLLFLISLLIVGFCSYIDSWEKDIFYDIAIAILVIVIITIIWAGIWTIVGRINKHKSYFSLHIGIFSSFFILNIIIMTVVGYISFFLHQNIFSEIMRYIMSSVILGGLVYSSLTFTTNMNKKSNFKTAFVFSVGVIISLIAIMMIKKDDFSTIPKYSGILKPYLHEFVIAQNIDEFMKENIDIFNHDILKHKDTTK